MSERKFHDGVLCFDAIRVACDLPPAPSWKEGVREMGV